MPVTLGDCVIGVLVPVYAVLKLVNAKLDEARLFTEVVPVLKREEVESPELAKREEVVPGVFMFNNEEEAVVDGVVREEENRLFADVVPRFRPVPADGMIDPGEVKVTRELERNGLSETVDAVGSFISKVGVEALQDALISAMLG